MSQEISSSRTLHRLIYASRQAFTPEMNPNEEIDGLIRASIRNNSATALTGLLLVHDGWFLQALEGRRGGNDHLSAHPQRPAPHREPSALRRPRERP
uniref:BLUF domain-containing protein n=1 Tax=Phenylobacterium glaciei TaxID=2803784 RepID=A0A974P4A3_9CAUL|nr:BLUF domain-containing protein [Phenylobacterium glaciei]